MDEDELLFFQADEARLDHALLFDLNLTTEDQAFTAFTNHLFAEFSRSRNSRHFQKPKYFSALKLLLLNLIYCQQVSRKMWLAVSRASNKYAIGKRHNPQRITRILLVALIDWLLQSDYVQEKKGYKDRHTGKGRKSRLLATAKLLNLLAQYQARGISIKQHEIAETIRLKDSNGDFIDYTDTRTTRRMRKVVSRLNSFMGKIRIELNGKQCPAPFLYRVFNDGDFKRGGRFYGGFFQNLPKAERAKLRINGDPVVEYDYSGMHLNLPYAKKKMQLQGAPYDIPSYPMVRFRQHQFREAVKKLVLIMLNTTSAKQAVNAAQHHLYSLQKKTALFSTKEEFKALIKTIEQRHRPIRGYFYKCAAKRLQYDDSRIAEEVMTTLLNSNVPVLPIHDSFITPSQHEAFLKQVMVDSFKKHTGAVITVSKK